MELEDVLFQQRTNAIALVQLAWGAILRLYTACDDIVFLYILANGHKTDYSLCSFELSGDAAFSNRLSEAKLNSRTWQQPLKDHQGFSEGYGNSFNTALVQELGLETESDGEANVLRKLSYAEVREYRSSPLRAKGQSFSNLRFDPRIWI